MFHKQTIPCYKGKRHHIMKYVCKGFVNKYMCRELFTANLRHLLKTFEPWATTPRGLNGSQWSMGRLTQPLVMGGDSLS